MLGMRITLRFVELLLIVLLSGCATSDVVVKDQNGKPIEGAKVAGTSVGGPFTMTNAKGEAPIPEATRYIAVSKAGYTEGDLIDGIQPTPIMVELVQCSPQFDPIEKLQS